MSSLEVCGIVFACIFGGTLLGMLLRRILPEHHVNADSKDAIKLGIGLIGTMAALVLGLMVSSAKGSYDTQKGEITQLSAKVIFLDRTLFHYEREAKERKETKEVEEVKETRRLLKIAINSMVDQIWPAEKSQTAQLKPTTDQADAFFIKLTALSPKSDTQRTLLSLATSNATELGQTRWLLYQQSSSSISTPFLIVLVFWLTIIFASFGLFAPANPTVTVCLFVCALSVAGAIFLVLELDRPFQGMIQISSESLRKAMDNIGQ